MKYDIKKEIPLILIALSPLVYLYFVWIKIPVEVPIVFDAQGEVNYFTSRIIFALSIIGLSFVGYFSGFIIHWLSDKNHIKESGSKFLMRFKFIMVLEMAFCSAFFIYVVSTLKPNRDIALIIVGLILILIGNIFQTIKKDSSLGYKIKWAMYSNEAWNKTHRFAGKMCILAGVVIGAFYFFPSVGYSTIWSVFGLALISPYFYSYFYSYFQFKKETTLN